MSSRNAQWSRRQILASLGAGVALTPFVPLLNASGQEASFPRRLILFYTPHGTVWEHWRPQSKGAETNFTLSRILQPLAALQKKICVIDGLGIRADGVGAPHTKGTALLWTASPLFDDRTFTREDCSGGCSFGWNTAPSFDQVLAQKAGRVTPYMSYEFGVSCGGGSPGAHTIYAGAGQPIPPRQNPVAVWQELFAEWLRPPAELKKLRARRQLSLNLLHAELADFERKVSRVDLAKVQAHREALEQLESQLSASMSQCVGTGMPDATQRPSDAADAVPWALEQQIKLLVAALSCDLMRVASLQVRLGENDNNPYRFVGVNDEHHTSSHDSSPEKQENITKIYTWYAQRFASLISQLDAVPEGSGTMLDHTLVIWGSELGTGSTHDFSNVPFVTAGGGAYGIKTGRYVQFAPGTTWHNRLIVSAMRYMGAQGVERFGTTDRESGSLPGLGI